MLSKTGDCLQRQALAVAGLSIVGRDRFGVFPLRGWAEFLHELEAEEIFREREREREKARKQERNKERKREVLTGKPLNVRDADLTCLLFSYPRSMLMNFKKGLLPADRGKC